ncbi:MAG TPA: dethiobiotin synthase [Candidatus Cybelea sp.]
MHRYFVTGTDTDVGKTRVAASLALALARGGQEPVIVKAVQTGLRPLEEGDAQRAARLAGVACIEIARYEKAADPWSAALAQGREPLAARALADALDALDGPLVVEGAGGIMAPLNASEHLGDVAALAHLKTIVAIGLRLGCLSHALLTLRLCRELALSVAGAVLVERWGPAGEAYRSDVVRALQENVRVLGILASAPDEAESIEAGAKLFAPLVNQER